MNLFKFTALVAMATFAFFILLYPYAYAQEREIRPDEPGYREPVWAFLASLILPGVGQMINGDIWGGIAWLGGFLAFWGIIALIVAAFIVPIPFLVEALPYVGGAIGGLLLVVFLLEPLAINILLLTGPFLTFFIFIFPLAYNLWCALDAANQASRLNRREIIF